MLQPLGSNHHLIMTIMSEASQLRDITFLPKPPIIGKGGREGERKGRTFIMLTSLFQAQGVFFFKVNCFKKKIQTHKSRVNSIMKPPYTCHLDSLLSNFRYTYFIYLSCLILLNYFKVNLKHNFISSLCTSVSISV